MIIQDQKQDLISIVMVSYHYFWVYIGHLFLFSFYNQLHSRCSLLFFNWDLIAIHCCLIILCHFLYLEFCSQEQVVCLCLPARLAARVPYWHVSVCVNHQCLLPPLLPGLLPTSHGSLPVSVARASERGAGDTRRHDLHAHIDHSARSSRSWAKYGQSLLRTAWLLTFMQKKWRLL